MVKRATFLQMFLVAALFTVVFAYGLAGAKEKLVLKYLPVDHDIETVRQANNSTTNPLHLYQTNSTETVLIVRNHTGCLTCRDYDRYGGSQCPDCCLYKKSNITLIHCQNETDPDCPNYGQWPFSVVNNPALNTTCPACISCNNTFKGNCSSCPGECPRFPQNYTPCFAKGCPASMKPNNTTGKKCVNVAPPPTGNFTHYDSWLCAEDNLKAPASCRSLNSYVPSCQNFTNATTAAYTKTEATKPECDAQGLSFPCYIYNVTGAYWGCVRDCQLHADQWEKYYYEYNNGTLGKKICPTGSNCTSGFKHNCDVDKCKAKIAYGCGNFTKEMCVGYEADYQEMLLGTVSDTFVEIYPNFRYKFVARSGERYMISWQVLCEVKKGNNKYNLYTMIKVWDQDHQNAKAGDKPVYQSIVHQKALGSTFYINAQTGMDAVKAPGLKPGKAYIVKLYYFLPNDGNTELQVDVELMQMILYRTKN